MSHAAQEGAAAMADDQQQEQQNDEQQNEGTDLAKLQETLRKERELRKAAEREAKDGKTAQQRLAEIEEANKSEQQKIADRAEKAERELAAERLNGWRVSVALEKGLTASQAKRLVGSTRDELAADADELIADLGAARQEKRKPSFDQGGGGRESDKPSAKEQARAEAEKRFPQIKQQQ